MRRPLMILVDNIRNPNYDPLMKSMKKIIGQYKLRKYSITRAGITANPLEMYNPVSYTTVSNNTLVTHGDYDFIGGDTNTYEFDFFTKVAGSNLECPCKIYGQDVDLGTLPNPSTGWTENVTQSDLDMIKTQEGTVLTKTTNVNTKARAMMVEVDLTPLCNSDFGGSNSALKSALKSINIDVWAKGNGSNGGIATDGVYMKTWLGSYGTGAGITMASNLTSNIVKMSVSDTRIPINQATILNDNKMYFIIYSAYPSDGTIPSSVSLDYLKVTVQLSRVPDVVTPIPVNLPKYFGVVVKGFSPMWAYDTLLDRRLFTLYLDTNNYFEFYYSQSNDKFAVKPVKNGVPYSNLISNIQTFVKNKAINFLIVRLATKITVFILKNNDIVEKMEIVDTNLLSGNGSIYLMQKFDGTQQADSFLDNLTLIDLEKAGKVKTLAKSVIIYNPSTWVEWNKPIGLIGDSTGLEFTIDGAVSTATSITTNLKQGGVKYGVLFNLVSSNLANPLRQTSPFTGSAFALPNIIGNNKYTFTTQTTISSNVLGIYTNSGETVAGLKAKIKDYRMFELPIGSEIENDFNTLTADQLATKYPYSADGVSRQDLLSDGEALSILKGQIHIKENNLVVNGDFSNGTTGYPSINASNFNTVNGEASYTATATGGRIYNNTFATITNNKYYYRAKIKANSNLAGLGRTSTLIKAHSGNGQYEDLSAIITALSTSYYISAIDTRTSGWDTVYFKDLVQIDLTALFGAGLEPTLAQCDLLFSQGTTNPIGLTNPELFNINAVTLHANATRSNGVITLNANNTFQTSTLSIPVLPNNRYEFSMKQGDGRFSIDTYYNNIKITNAKITGNGIGTMSFITEANTNKIIVNLYNTVVGTFTFSNISLKRKD